MCKQNVSIENLNDISDKSDAKEAVNCATKEYDTTSGDPDILDKKIDCSLVCANYWQAG